MLKLKLSIMKDQVKVELGAKTRKKLSSDYIQVIMIDQTLKLEEIMLWEKLWVTLPGEELILELVTTTLYLNNIDLIDCM